MKKLFLLVCVLLLALSFTACQKEGSVSAPPSSGETASQYQKRYPGQYADKDYSSIHITDQSGENIAPIVIDLWYAVNEIYSPDDTVMFQLGEEVVLSGGNTPLFVELKNYPQVVPTIFTEKGIAQLEKMDTTAFVKKDGKMYRVTPWGTGVNLGYALEDMKSKEVKENQVTVTVKYITNPRFYAGEEEASSDYIPEYASADFTVKKVDGVWLVDDYIYFRNTLNEEPSSVSQKNPGVAASGY